MLSFITFSNLPFLVLSVNEINNDLSMTQRLKLWVIVISPPTSFLSSFQPSFHSNTPASDLFFVPLHLNSLSQHFPRPHYSLKVCWLVFLMLVSCLLMYCQKWLELFFINIDFLQTTTNNQDGSLLSWKWNTITFSVRHWSHSSNLGWSGKKWEPRNMTFELLETEHNYLWPPSLW